MHRKFFALLIASAMVIAAADLRTAQAADADDIAKWVAGLTALAIIGKAVSDNDNERSHRHQTRPGKKPHHQRHLLPVRCRRVGDLQGRRIRGLAAGCLRRNGVDLQALPRACVVRFRDRSRGRRMTLFTGRCLHQQGYHLARY